jgi:hypothetical protein
MINASQLRAGMAITYEGQDYKVIAAEYHPGQGKMGGVTHARLQSLATGNVLGAQHPFGFEAARTAGRAPDVGISVQGRPSSAGS